MDPEDAFSSCAGGLLYLVNGLGTDLDPQMSDEEAALAIVRAARRDSGWRDMGYGLILCAILRDNFVWEDIRPFLGRGHANGTTRKAQDTTQAETP
jgi:hypothetical protein